jgi:predicted RNA-binding Zn-ribbon protein involved in translation (DUF1610 family)
MNEIEEIKIVIDKLWKENEENSEKEAYQDDYRRNLITIAALVKQIPKKAERLTAGQPIKIGNMTFGKGTSIYKCPSCGTLIARHYVYCNACGQYIDWEE